MKWHDHPYSWKAMAQYRKLKGTPKECVDQIGKILNSVKIKDFQYYNTMCQLHSEIRWMQDKRPYYDVYPSVTDAFVNIDLNKIQAHQIKLPIRDLMVRFQVGNEFQASKKTKVHSFLVSDAHFIQDKTKKGIIVSINTGDWMEDIKVPIPIVRGIVLNDTESIEDHLKKGRENIDSEEVDEEAVTNVMRLIVALCLLKDNPDLIEPEPLDSDRRKWETSHDPKLLEKAERRGKRAWSVGKQIEVAPGFRRPHFAIRWCGKGGTDPQLRPIKGCLVNRRKIEEVPTGYLDKE